MIRRSSFDSCRRIYKYRIQVYFVLIRFFRLHEQYTVYTNRPTGKRPNLSPHRRSAKSFQLRWATLWSVITLRKISKFSATWCKILRLKCRKFDFYWAPRRVLDPAGEHTTLLWPLAGAEPSGWVPPRTPIGLDFIWASLSPGPSTLRLSTPTWKFLATGLFLRQNNTKTNPCNVWLWTPHVLVLTDTLVPYLLYSSLYFQYNGTFSRICHCKRSADRGAEG